jgi:curved DNA-binding protein
MPGQDFEARVQVRLDDVINGVEIEIPIATTEIGQDGAVRRVNRPVKVRIPKGATDGQRLRVPGKGGQGMGGGRAGDLYLDIKLEPHALYKIDGHDLYLEVPAAPWEAALGASVEIRPHRKGQSQDPVRVASGAEAASARPGLPRPQGGESGDLYAVLQLVTPSVLSEAEKELYGKLAQASSFNPRGHFG